MRSKLTWSALRNEEPARQPSPLVEDARQSSLPPSSPSARPMAVRAQQRIRDEEETFLNAVDSVKRQRIKGEAMLTRTPARGLPPRRTLAYVDSQGPLPPSSPIRSDDESSSPRRSSPVKRPAAPEPPTPQQPPTPAKQSIRRSFPLSPLLSATDGSEADSSLAQSPSPQKSARVPLRSAAMPPPPQPTAGPSTRAAGSAPRESLPGPSASYAPSASQAKPAPQPQPQSASAMLQAFNHAQPKTLDDSWKMRWSPAAASGGALIQQQLAAHTFVSSPSLAPQVPASAPAREQQPAAPEPRIGWHPIFGDTATAEIPRLRTIDERERRAERERTGSLEREMPIW